MPEEVVKFMRLPGLGPKTARRIWKEPWRTIAGLKEAAEQEAARVLAGLGAKSEEKILKRSPRRRGPARVETAAGDGLPVLLDLVEELRAHPAAVKVSEAGLRAGAGDLRDLDVIATSTDPPALIEAFTSRDNVADVIAKGETKATVLTNEGLGSTSASSHRRATATCSSTSRARRSTTSRCARTPSGGFSVSEYSVTNTETGEEFTAADEEELYAHLGYAYIPPELRENGGELAAAGTASCRRWSSAATSGATCTRTRRGRTGSVDPGDGARGTGARARASPCATTRSASATAGCSTVGGDRRPQRAAGTLPDPEGDRGQHPRQRRARRHRRPARAARLGDGVGAHELRQGSDRAGAERDAESARRLHRPPDEPVIGLQPVGDRGEVVAAAPRPARSRSTARPARPPRRERPARGRGGLTLTISSDGHSTKALRYVELGVAQRRAWLTKAQILNTRTWAEIEAAQMSSRRRAAVDWVASYLERGEPPVLAQVEPGELARLPPPSTA